MEIMQGIQQQYRELVIKHEKEYAKSEVQLYSKINPFLNRGLRSPISGRSRRRF